MLPEAVCDRLSESQDVGLVLCRTPHGNTHTGITFAWAGQLYLYHQAFHYLTRAEAFDEEITRIGGASLVVAVPYPPARQKAIAGFLNSLRLVDPQYPYSLRYDPDAVIDPVLGRLVTNAGLGLSCVSFVLAILRSCRVQLVDAATWPTDRPEDLLAQESLIGFLTGRTTPEHLEAVKAERGCTRIRAEEAVAAGGFLQYPVQYDVAEPASIGLLVRLDRPEPETVSD